MQIKRNPHHTVFVTSLASLILLVGSSGLSQDTSAAQNDVWPSWRGPTQNGVAESNCDPPIEWSEKKNIAWKTPLVGLGHSTPAVWKDHVFLTSAEPYGEKFAPIPETAPGAHDNSQITQRFRFWVTCVSRKSGKIRWTRKVNDLIPHEGGHISGSLASASPVTDGKYVYAYFGSHGLYCLDFEGKVIWEKQIGRMNSKHAHGEGSSPVLSGSTLVINWDHQDQSFVTAIDSKTGKTLWKVKRDEVTSWSSPITVKVEKRTQVIVPGTNRTRGYDLETGKVVWECAGLSNNVVASPVHSNGIVYVGSSYDTQAMLAIRLTGAKGDISESEQVLWKRDRHTPYVPSPLIYKDVLYFFRHYQGILYRVDGPSGKEKDAFRLVAITNIYASPVAAAGRIYISDRGGRTIVLEHGEPPKMLSLNRLKDSFSASPIVVENEILLRGESNIYCIRKE